MTIFEVSWLSLLYLLHRMPMQKFNRLVCEKMTDLRNECEARRELHFLIPCIVLRQAKSWEISLRPCEIHDMIKRLCKPLYHLISLITKLTLKHTVKRVGFRGRSLSNLESFGYAGQDKTGLRCITTYPHPILEKESMSISDTTQMSPYL